MSVSNGNKISIAIASSAVVTVSVVAAGAYLKDTTIIVSSVAAFFGFVGGLVMGKQL